MREGRLDRQLRISGWDQAALEEAKIGVIGDDDLLTSLYVMSAAALGIQRLVVIAPRLEKPLVEIAHSLNPALQMAFLEGYYTHGKIGDFLTGCGVVVDLSSYGLANKLALQKGFDEGMPVVRAFCSEENGRQGFRVFTYSRGREWEELNGMVASRNLPGNHFDDGVLDIIASGVALEETTNILMRHKVSEEVVIYERKSLPPAAHTAKIGIVGAGALGNFVGLGLAWAGFRHITFLDPDVVEVTNLNRQVLLADSLGVNKAEAAARKLNGLFGLGVRGRATYIGRESDLLEYGVVFDCVDNFETRIVLSERCKAERKVLISGGTGAHSGQVIVYDPAGGSETPAEVLGLYAIVEKRSAEGDRRQRASCEYVPEPSVIMVNQIIGGLMVEGYRAVVAGEKPANVFYDSKRDRRF
jgi:molybdopterin/thiamine biosynthesis adenylyltransferase